MRRLRFSLVLALAMAWLAVPVLADRVDIADSTTLGTLVHSGSTNLTGSFSAHLDMNVYYNASNGIYSYVFTLSMPSGLIDGPSFNVSSGSMFDLANLNWGMITGTTSPGMDIDFAGVTPDGSTFFIFSNFDRDDQITLYAQSTRPPDEIVAALLENITHRTAGGRIPPPVPEPGTLLLMGGGLALASRAIRRRMAKRNKV